jgi:hypothetical protein
MAKNVDYEVHNALIQEGQYIYTEKDAALLLYPTLRNCAFASRIHKPTLWDENQRNRFPEAINSFGKSYTINEMGYRGEEFGTDPAEIVTAGCSQTWGSGIPDEFIWPQILAKRTNKKVDNVAYYGKSIPGIVEILFCYFREIGNPKYVFVAFPDLYRMLFPTTANLMHTKNVLVESEYPEKDQPMIANTNLGETRLYSQKPKYFKTPYFMEEVMTGEITIWQGLQYIQMLQKYCDAAGIILKYGTWDISAYHFFKAIDTDKFYKDYVDLEPHKWHIFNPNDGKEYYIDKAYCHEDQRDDENDFFWERANDFNPLNGNAHIGVHKHIHIADVFEKVVLNG